VRLLLELYCVIVSKQLPSYYLCEIYNGIHLYQFTFELLLFFFLGGCGVGFEQKNSGGPTDLVKKAPISGLVYPYSPPLNTSSNHKPLGFRIKIYVIPV